jgi:hypothetical protein
MHRRKHYDILVCICCDNGIKKTYLSQKFVMIFCLEVKKEKSTEKKKSHHQEIEL